MNDEKNNLNQKAGDSGADIFAPIKKAEPAENKHPVPAARPTSAPKRAPAAARPSGVPTPKKMPEKDADRTRVGANITAPRKAVEPPVSIREEAGATRVGGTISVPKSAQAKEPPKHITPETAERQPAKRGVKKEMTPEAREKLRLGMKSTAIRALLYIAFVIGISTILSICGIKWGNDIFALVKDEVVCQIEVPENATVSEISTILSQNNIIEYPLIFRMYIGYKYRNADPGLEFRAGSYEIKSTMNYDQIVSTIKYKRTRQIITLTIPEGYTVNEIIELFLSNGMGTREGFVDAINNFDYNYTFMDKLKTLPLSPDRIYRLEGYLFPDTYDFYTDASEIAIIDKMLTTFNSKFEEAYYERCSEIGLNLDQVITIASLVQAEGKIKADFYPISGVFFNRLRSTDLKMLQSDATIQYCLNDHKENLTQEDLAFDSPYNTYTHEGLTPGAICNPGWEAIQAALYPEAHKYRYFNSDTDGSTLFATTLIQHNRNVAAVAAAKEKGTSVD